MAKGEIKDYLVDLARAQPDIVKNSLASNDLVKKSKNLSYEIDNPEIYRALGDFPEGAIPYGPVNRALKSSPQGISDIFGKRKVIPFSEMVNCGLGQCLEKAILIQLASQKTNDSFLINGAVEQNGFLDFHAYNVVFIEGKPILIDCENPLERDEKGKISVPTVLPILGLNSDKIELPPHPQLKWNYYLK